MALSARLPSGLPSRPTPDLEVAPADPDPFASMAQAPDPFASMAQAPDPFASMSEAPDPFASAAEAPDPFAPSAEPPDPFATTAEPDPFATMAETPDPFAPVAEAPPIPAMSPAFAPAPPEGRPPIMVAPFLPSQPAFGAAPFDSYTSDADERSQQAHNAISELRGLYEPSYAPVSLTPLSVPGGLTRRQRTAPAPVASVAPAAAMPARDRSATQVRGMLTGFRAGVERGRSTGDSAERGSTRVDKPPAQAGSQHRPSAGSVRRKEES